MVKVICKRCGLRIAFCKGLCQNCYMMDYRNEKKNDDKCIDCGKKIKSNSVSRCYSCLFKYRERMRKRRYSKKKQQEFDDELKELGVITWWFWQMVFFNVRILYGYENWQRLTFMIWKNRNSLISVSKDVSMVSITINILIVGLMREVVSSRLDSWTLKLMAFKQIIM